MDQPDQPLDLANIQNLLQARDDTQRFVGLALLKSVLDNSQQLRQDEAVVQSLWASLSVKFVDRLLRTGSNPSNQNAKDMLDLAVSVLHTFAALLPESSRADAKFTGRIPGLVGSVLNSSVETTGLTLQILHTLVSSPKGARVLINCEDVSPLTEDAPSHPLVLEILSFAWLNGMSDSGIRDVLPQKIDGTVRNLASSFTGTDAVTLLQFLGAFLPQADPAAFAQVLPIEPKWLKKVCGYIHKLVMSRPTAEARSAYTNAAAALLRIFPTLAPGLLFTDDRRAEKPPAYLLVNLLLIDIRSSAPTLLGQLNARDSAATTRRLASAFDVICIFEGFLVRSLDGDIWVMSPDSLLKIRKSISDTMSVTIEYLRDRWDASVAGAMGLHPDARAGNAETATGSHRTLAWDSMANPVDDDPLILSAVRALALWLREDDNDFLRKEATGLMDMLVDLYRSSAPGKLDFRSPILVAFEALVVLDEGHHLLLHHDGWQLLSRDLVEILNNTSTTNDKDEASRGVEVARVLIQVTEQETSGTEEAWMDLITAVAAWNVPDQERPPETQEFRVAVLQLCCSLLQGASHGARTRYKHSIGAIAGIAMRLSRCIERDSPFKEAMEDVMNTLNELV
ncbi:hypothetical protein L249_7972 [Ophiocordyceps polyrhachis-furcata BCC 54312]|uniref:DUF1941 family protein n=1 Tax=Ophiocordyceps polyrhachis-furcata BCC 54312 TaxID=1330021 RepID=A0A367LGW6_9HYPO|nr:hypothetical protein L249_7972 [Ophiocordyceps polyrhachis-furcata BCC 54312]